MLPDNNQLADLRQKPTQDPARNKMKIFSIAIVLFAVAAIAVADKPITIGGGTRGYPQDEIQSEMNYYRHWFFSTAGYLVPIFLISAYLRKLPCYNNYGPYPRSMSTDQCLRISSFFMRFHKHLC